MFTGIIKELGTISKIVKKGDNAKVEICAPKISIDVKVGDSVATNGVCLTVVGINGEILSFDISTETMAVTDLGDLKNGDRVNLEPSLRPIDFIGGHFVTGHVEEVAVIAEKKKTGDDYQFRITASKDTLGVTIPRGSMTVDGISLTVTQVLDDSFEVVIIPHTMRETTLGFKEKGDKLNLESDLIGRYIRRIIDSQNEGSDDKALRLADLLNDTFS